MTDEQHEQDLERVSGQNSFTDLTRHAEERPSSGFFRGAIDSMVRSVTEKTPYGRAMHGRTDFDEHRLNDMIALVEQANPEDLETSGKALWEARDAISDAAKELDGRIEKVHWVGEAGEAFRKWGRSLVISTYGLSDFAGGAGDQISAAAVGLAAVRGSMPPRDTRPAEKALRPGQLPAPKQVEGNAEYAEAVRVEKDRQEAINQMNRLSSYYAVAREQLIELKSPEFKAMPDVGVPKPEYTGDDTVLGQHRGMSAAHQANGVPGSVNHQPLVTAAGRAETYGSTDVPLRPTETVRPIREPDAAVGMTIDGVGTLPSVTPAHPGEVGPTAGAPGGAGGANNNGFGSGYGTPVANTVSRKGAGGPGGFRGPVAAQGRAATAGANNVGPGRTANGPVSQMGRAATTGQPIAKGTSPGAKPLPMGPGVTGGTARPTGASGPRGGGGTGAGHANGVVGGRPVTGAAMPMKNGPKGPRGTVVGAETAAGPRSAERRPGQSGVFGGPASAGRSGSAANRSRVGRAPSASITGSPTARNSAANAELNGMTHGGSGLVRGPGGNGKPKPASDRNTEGTQRDARLTEEEQTHLPSHQRRGAPPVAD
ncbi:WXG100 family type VII secretion target [Streptomyces sp. MAR25Y5]|uniref:WXG100 family type VII secretion target n=1 Tax=Streptomyces sp. MAR25Y5 TaxID=2962028 RepID=UPI0020B8FD4E|nr:WXG100 family type VII secretion target [Streptomyces sp. MAR25Y5]MCP3770348.1 WXG100 family type VII secretion target [Streptomyces sp. MAR25Y5]